jgi:hypothetical protein
MQTSTLSNSVQDNCDVCGSQVNLSLCGRCKSVHYCSRQHQAKAWSQHKITCKPPNYTSSSRSSSSSSSSSSTTKNIYKLYDQTLDENPELHQRLLAPGSGVPSRRCGWRHFTHPKLPGFIVVYSYLTQQEHDLLLEMALEEKENAGYGGERPHWMLTCPHIPSLDFYASYRLLFQQLKEDGILPLDSSPPGQLTINYYEAKEGLAPHIDNPKFIGDLIIGFSLGSSCVMEFQFAGKEERSKDRERTRGGEEEEGKVKIGDTVQVALHPRCIMIQRPPMRYEWKHGISTSPTQIVS